ncbi:MAG: hypothetical protein WC670_20950, partial [Pseudolabrys sp.]
ELVWAGGRTGAAVAQGLYWWRSAVARAAGSLSRYRERRRLAKAARLAAIAAAGPMIPPERLPAAELAAAPLPAEPAVNDIASGAPPEGGNERRQRRGKRRKAKADGADDSGGPGQTEPAPSA